VATQAASVSLTLLTHVTHAQNEILHNNIDGLGAA